MMRPSDGQGKVVRHRDEHGRRYMQADHVGRVPVALWFGAGWACEYHLRDDLFAGHGRGRRCAQPHE